MTHFDFVIPSAILTLAFLFLLHLFDYEHELNKIKLKLALIQHKEMFFAYEPSANTTHW